MTLTFSELQTESFNLRRFNKDDITCKSYLTLIILKPEI